MKRDKRERTNLASLMVAVLLFLGLSLSAELTRAQAGPGGGPPMQIDKAGRAEIIDSVTYALNEVYVFPGVASDMEKFVRENLKDGKYDTLETVDAFVRALTMDLQEISRDRHLNIRYASPEMVAQSSEDLTEEEEEKIRQEQLEMSRRENFQFKKLEIMPGNVGYMRFDGFYDTFDAGPTAVAAVNFLAHTDALIIDLRTNGGGSPSMIQLITSYFFDTLVHLNSFYVRQQDSIQQFWTTEYVAGPRMADVDLYVLTSSYTFSAAEEFTYNIKNTKRGTIVGETTGGGAHPVSRRLFSNLNCGMNLPFGRAINPISGTNWEGTGISPDIETTADNALDQAYLEALTRLKNKIEDGDDRAFAIQWAIDDLNWELNPPIISSESFASYVGVYGPRTLTMEEGSLFYQREGRPKMKMLPMSETLFQFDDTEYFRLEVVMDGAGKPVKLIGHYDNGFVDESPRTDGS